MTDMIPQPLSTDLATAQHQEQIGQAANQVAARHAFDDYLKVKSSNTKRRQLADLALFVGYLADVTFLKGAAHIGSLTYLQAEQDRDKAALRRIEAERRDHARSFQETPKAWAHITHGLVEGFLGWQLQQGYAIRSVNVRLSTIRRYAALAFKAGAISSDTHALIRTVTGYSRDEGINLDEKRPQQRLERPGVKKAESTKLDEAAAQLLKQDHPDTPQGRRDALLLCLLLDHGLRCGEVALLRVGHFNLKAGTLTFYRPKVKLQQTHKLSRDTRRALEAWIHAGDCPLSAEAPILRGSRKNGALTAGGMSERAITARVCLLGEQAGIERLSAHDCRHYWATYWAERVERLPRGVFSLQEAGGWSSLAMPRRYVEAATIANQGMDAD